MFRTPIYRDLHRGLRDVVGARTANQLAKLGVHTVDDLVRHVPRRYISGTGMSSFADLKVGEDIAVVATSKGSTIKHGSRMRVESTIEDEAGRTIVVTQFVPVRKGKPMTHLAEWWHGQLHEGARGLFIGKLGVFNNTLQLTHPDYVILEGARITQRRDETKRASDEAMTRMAQRATMIGIYPATSTFPTWLVAETIQMQLPTISGDTLPDWVVDEAGVPRLDEALRDVHEPVSLEQAEEGKQRLRFDEAFGIQLAMAHRRATLASETATRRPRRVGGILDALDDRLPFTLTKGQQEIGETIFDELARPVPMHRLLQGEVGSGKTLVALRAMLGVVDAGGQAVLVAPTEVLAKQHYRSISAMLGDLGEGRMLGAHPEATSVTLLTGSLSAAERREALNQIVTGDAGIVIGTHALFSDPVEFFDLGLVVVDEQHRFGVEQRSALNAKAENKPHMLAMTATPIPRSIAMTIFGDLTVSELRERPKGRAPVQTVFVNTYTHPAWVERTWERVREEVAAGRQVFVVCPTITPDESGGKDERQLTSVTELANLLARGPLQGLELGIVHGKQPVDERDTAMAAFVEGRTDVLIATTVIEVGVDVPNASMMVIMDADRFGISQLHQLRGRIGRGEHEGLCLLLAPLKGDEPAALERLEAVAASTDGFELAETDLAIRREGDVLGADQSGASSLKLLRLADVELIEQAKALAEKVLADDRAADDPLLGDLITKAEQVAAGEWLEKG